MRAIGLRSGAAALAVLLSAAAAGAQQGAIELSTRVEKRVLLRFPDGRVEERRVPADKVVPGDVVAYTIEARNVTARPAERVVITDPIPTHTRYVDGSAQAKDAELQFSVDGGKRFDRPERLEVTEPNGTRRAARASDYTHIRWVFAEPLAPAESRSAQFLAQLQ
jgi:uncharacterized repeat protein (TIGR01451 family)